MPRTVVQDALRLRYTFTEHNKLPAPLQRVAMKLYEAADAAAALAELDDEALESTGIPQELTRVLEALDTARDRAATLSMETSAGKPTSTDEGSSGEDATGAAQGDAKALAGSEDSEAVETGSESTGGNQSENADANHDSDDK